VMIIDEAHERSLTIDFILGLVKRVIEERKEFKVIVSSATINAEVFSEYFGECPIVKIEAQVFPVTLVYDPPLAQAVNAPGSESRAESRAEGRYANGEYGRSRGDKWKNGGGNQHSEALLKKIETIVERFVGEKRPGDILIFLPGEKMIKDCMALLLQGSVGKYLHILPLYGRLGKEEQERVFEDPPRGKTKVVIATNIAETSVTIDGITAVLDSGLAKLSYYNPRTFTSSLVESPVSRASANQRKGRAGRTREGSCYRLYTRKDFEGRPLFTTEEIYRTDLSEVVLRMADLGITGFEDFDFISPPGREGIVAAIETLKLLDALEEDRTLSSTGRMMTEFPLPPRHSRIIVEALLKYPDVVEETIIAASFLSTQSPYLLPPGEELDARRAHHRFRHPDGDFVSYLKLYGAYTESANKASFCGKNYLDERAMAEIANVISQLEEIVSGMRIPLLSGGNTGDYLCCVGRGLIQFVCVREGKPRGRFAPETYRSLTADRIMIHPGSVMFKRGEDEASPRYIVAGEIVRTTRMYAMSVSPLSLETLRRISPFLLSELEGTGAEEELSGGRDGGAYGGARARKEKYRDFTNNIKLGSEIFPVETIKGKKHVILPWEKLVTLKDSDKTVDPDQYRGLRGIITVKGYTLLRGEKLSLIFTLLPALEPEGAFERKWQRKTTFYSGEAESLARLIGELPLILLPAAHGKPRPAAQETDGRAPAEKYRKELGFIALFTSFKGGYWFRCSRGFHTALNESMASLEALIDELGDEVDVAVKHEVNLCYRRLADILNG